MSPGIRLDQKYLDRHLNHWEREEGVNQVYLVVENTRTRIYGATPPLLEEIDKVTSFAQEHLGTDPKRYNMADAEFAWDGYVRFLDVKGDVPSIPSGLRDIVAWRIHQLGVPVMVQDHRVGPRPDLKLYPDPIELWAHQQLCKEQMIAQPDCVARMPPRAGKTRTLLETVRELSLPTLWIAPTNSIVTQTVKEAGKWFGPDAVHVQKATWKESGTKDALLHVCTSGGMLSLPPDYFLGRHMLVCDEVHHFLADKAWGRYLTENTPHIYHRKGMTGTFFRSNGDDLSLLAFIGRVGYSISSEELLQKGFLVPTYTVFIPIDGPKIKPTSREWMSPGGKGTLGIATHSHRCDVVAAVAKHLQALGRTCVILVATKQQGNLIKQRLDVLFPPKAANVEFETAEFVSTNRTKNVIQKIYKSFVDRQEVKVLIGTSMVGEGIDLPPADALIFAAGGKAAVSYVQALYRVCTANPGKQYGVVVDFIDRHYEGLLNHSRTRWAIARSDPVFRLSHLNGLGEFPQWAANTAVST